MSKTVIRITAHYLDDYEACPLYFHRTTNLLRGEPSKAVKLAKGTAMHLLLAHYYKGVRDKIDFDENVTAAVKKFEVEAMTVNGLLMEDVDPVISTFHEYTSFYRDRDNFEVVSVEEPLSLVLYEDENVSILYEGTQDLNVRSIEGIVLPYDHKTEGSRYTPSGLSNQFLGYCVLTKGNRMIRNAIGYQTSKKPAEKFYRTMFSYSDAMLNWWKEETIKKALRLVANYKTDVWEPRFNACDNLHRGGCPFRKVCLEDRGLWAEILETEFVHVPLYDRR